MLYSEFVAGTGCRETDHNYQVYKELEIIYMNTDCTKEHIYEMGRKLVDNSKSEEEVRFENQIKGEIEDNKEQLSYWKSEAKRLQEMRKQDGYSEDNFWKIYYRDQIRYAKDQARFYQNRINELKWVLA